jgi:uncharacterized protein (DUF885 family)
LSDGAKYYQFLIRRTTTTELTADQIHQIGLDEVKKDEADMLAIAQKLGFQDLKSFRASLKDNPKLHPASADALLAAYRGYLTPMQAKLPQLFGRLPKAPFEVAAVPDYLEKTSAPAYYEPGTPDGSRPAGCGLTPTTPPSAISTRSKTSHITKAFQAITCKFRLRRRLDRTAGIPQAHALHGVHRGLGLYAERLGKDVGFYQDPYSDYGRLEGDIWRAIRLVVDTGVHSQLDPSADGRLLPRPLVRRRNQRPVRG